MRPRSRTGAKTALRAPTTTRASPRRMRLHSASRRDGVSREWRTAQFSPKRRVGGLDHLARERDLGHEVDDAPALGQGGLGGLEEDLGLARAGEAVEVLEPGPVARYALESRRLLVRELERARRRSRTPRPRSAARPTARLRARRALAGAAWPPEPRPGRRSTCPRASARAPPSRSSKRGSASSDARYALDPFWRQAAGVGLADDEAHRLAACRRARRPACPGRRCALSSLR